jgi:hypothetical protein
MLLCESKTRKILKDRNIIVESFANTTPVFFSSIACCSQVSFFQIKAFPFFIFLRKINLRFLCKNYKISFWRLSDFFVKIMTFLNKHPLYLTKIIKKGLP